MKLTRLAALAAIALTACDSDPTNDGAGDPFAIVTNRSQTTVARDVQFTLTAYTIDRNNRRIPGALTATSAGPAVSLDSVVYVQELSETRVFARGVAASAQGTDIHFAGQAGLSATTRVIVN
jgi:hypothetical protein